MPSHRPLIRLLFWTLVGAGGSAFPASAGMDTARGASGDSCAGASGASSLEPFALASWIQNDSASCASVPAPQPRVASGVIRPAPAPVVEATVRSAQEIRAEQGAYASEADGGGYGDFDRYPAAPQRAAVAQSVPPPVLASAAVVGDDTLAALRGGFETTDGLRVSFGIERAIYVNGALQSVTTLNVEDMARLHGGALPELPPGAAIAVIQNGPGNQFQASGLSASTLATVVQNSLDNQKIQTVTTISATVNSLEMMRGARMQNSVQEALTRALVR